MKQLSFYRIFILVSIFTCSQNIMFAAVNEQLAESLTTFKNVLIELSKQLQTIARGAKAEEETDLKKLSDTKGSSVSNVLSKLQDLKLKLPTKDIEGNDFVPRFVTDIVNTLMTRNSTDPSGEPHCSDYVLIDGDLELSMCCCHEIDARLRLVLSQLDRINQLRPNKTTPFVHASRNSYKLLQEYMLAFGLLLCGYKNITICCIDEGYEGEGFKNLQKVFTKLATKYGATINLIFFNGVYDYLEAIQKKEAPRAHSFSSIDPSLIERGFFAGTPMMKNFTNKSVFIALGPPAEPYDTVFYALLNHNYDQENKHWNITPQFFKNKAPEDKQATYDSIFSKLKQLETNIYANTDAIIKEITKISNELNPREFDSALDSKNLIEGAKAHDNPIIFEGNKEGDNVVIKEYTLKTVRKKITIEKLFADKKICFG